MQPTAQSFWHSADLMVRSGRAFVCFKEKVLSFTKETEVASQQERSVFGPEVWSLHVRPCEANWEVKIGRRCKFEWLFVCVCGLEINCQHISTWLICSNLLSVYSGLKLHSFIDSKVQTLISQAFNWQLKGGGAQLWQWHLTTACSGAGLAVPFILQSLVHVVQNL